jgi:hypothetical protein
MAGVLSPLQSDESGFCVLPAAVFALFAELVTLPDSSSRAELDKAIGELRSAIADDLHDTQMGIGQIVSDFRKDRCTTDVRAMRTAVGYDALLPVEQCLQDLLVLAACLRRMPRVASAVRLIAKLRRELDVLVDSMADARRKIFRLTYGKEGAADVNAELEEIHSSLRRLTSIVCPLQQSLVTGNANETGRSSGYDTILRVARGDAAASMPPVDGASVASSQSQYSGLTGLTTQDVAQQPVYEHGFTDLKSIETFLSRSRRGRR